MILKKILKIIGNDKSIHYSIFTKIWTSFAGLATIYLILNKFTEQQQGYYYVFQSIIAIQVFIELGFFIIVVNFCSNEWGYLSLNNYGEIVGPKKNVYKLISFGKFVFKWYGVVAVFFVLIVSTVGVFIFYAKNLPPDEWLWQWILLVIFTGLNIWLLPLLSILEGCGQTIAINKFRFTQSLISSLLLWVSFLMGLGLWSLVIPSIVVLFRDVYLVLIKYRNFFKNFIGRKIFKKNLINYKKDIWPLQWRLGIQSIAGYFIFQSIVPIIFYFHGIGDAGKIGMTLQISIAVQSLGQAVLQAKMPLFGNLIACRKFEELSGLVGKIFKLSISLIIFTSLTLICLIFLLKMISYPLVNRVVDPLLFIPILTAQIFIQIVQIEAAILRAFKMEPFLLLGTLGPLITGLAILISGAYYSITEVIFIYFISALGTMIWATYIYRNNNFIKGGGFL